MLAPASLSQAEAPKQTKLLGTTVEGVGVITTVSVQNVWRWALIERPDGSEAHAFIVDLKRDQLIFPSEPQPYRQVRRRISYGFWEDVYELLPSSSGTPGVGLTGCSTPNGAGEVSELQEAA